MFNHRGARETHDRVLELSINFYFIFIHRVYTSVCLQLAHVSVFVGLPQIILSYYLRFVQTINRSLYESISTVLNYTEYPENRKISLNLRVSLMNPENRLKYPPFSE